MRFYRLQEACRLTGLSASTLRRRADQGVISFKVTKGGHRRFDVETYLKKVVKSDVLTEFAYDPTTNRYRWKEGTGVGQFASKEAILNRTKAFIDSESQALVNLAEEKIDLHVFQNQAAKHLKNIHIAQAILAKDGPEKMKSEDYLRVGRELKKQYHAGRDNLGRKYGLKWLAQDIADGQLTVAMLKQRLSLFAGSGKLSYWDAWKTNFNNQTTGIRTLKPGAQHCDFCLIQSRIGPRLLRDIPLPGCCTCFGNCKCTIKALSIEEHINLINKD